MTEAGRDARGSSPTSMTRRAFVGLGIGAGAALTGAAAGGGALGYFLHRVNRVGSFPPEEMARLRGEGSSPLFRRHPLLARSVPWRPLGSYPTPVESLPLPEGAGGVNLLVKRDDLTSALYGGNKVRKLEHFLAEAELLGRDTLVTLGGLGSNHCLATVLHGRASGFAAELSLFDQPVTPAVRANVKGFLHAGARLHYAGGQAAAMLATRRIMDGIRRRGGRPYFINVGGTSRLGTVGYVAAALELAEQVRAGELPEPDRVFVALGTCGTAAGLVAGLRIAGLRTRVSAVRVTGLFPANRLMVRYFARDVARWLHAADPTILPVRIGVGDFDVVPDYRGPGYGVATDEAEAAVRWAAPRLGLETTYTGKALAACLDYCVNGARPGETVLFWHTYSAASPPQAPSLEGLPPELAEVLG